MEFNAHFSNIHKVLSKTGIKMSVEVIFDEINQGPSGLNFHRLDALGWRENQEKRRCIKWETRFQ